MKTYIKLAWRNIWRNKRRTLITAASIFFAVFFALNMRAYQLGTYSHWTKGIVESYTGFIQVHAKGYWDERSIDNTFEYPPEMEQMILKTSNVTTVTPRLESGGLASFGAQTKLAIVFGIDPEKENATSKLKEKLVTNRITKKTFDALRAASAPDTVLQMLRKVDNASYANIDKFRFEVIDAIGSDYAEQYFDVIKESSAFANSYLKATDSGALVADRLAKFLNLTIGDTLILTGYGYHGASAAGLFVVQGILKFPSPQMDNAMVYIPLHAAQTLYSADNRLTSLAVNIKQEDNQSLATTKAAIQSELTNEHEVMDWMELNELVMRQIAADNDSAVIMLYLLYLVIGFGIFGTVLMMTTERKREFGVMVAIGMQKIKLAVIVTVEMLFIGVLGIVSGVLGSLPIIYYYHIHPIRMAGDLAASIEIYGIEAVLPFAWQTDYFVSQSVIVIFLVIIASIYPIYSITRLKVINALRA